MHKWKSLKERNHKKGGGVRGTTHESRLLTLRRKNKFGKNISSEKEVYWC
jgi:hypothetical protein